MDTKRRKVGRPKASPQMGPLVLSERRNRTKIEIEVGADAAEELAEYVRWIELSEGMATAEARATTVEFALRKVFKADRLWQEHRGRSGVREEMTAAGRTELAPPPLPAPTAPHRPVPLPAPTTAR
jgi:hypothetical protein